MKMIMTMLLLVAATFGANAAEPTNEEQVQQMIYQALFHDPASPRIGAASPKLTIISFTDYNCPYCKKFDPMLEKIVEKYPDVAVIFKLLPFRGESSSLASRVALTTWREHPQQFLALHQSLMSKTGNHTAATIDAAVAKSGVTAVKPDELSRETLNLNLQLARVVGVQGTPATLVGDTLLAGAVPWDSLEELVKEKREQANEK
ncbi:DsbA family protein [Buttiauxella agrestis]|uniref:ScsC family secreted protein n=1 Tax=Buttiauxella agrestis ATCC 33320 TaxID=1006004 RepID=A0A085GBW6_9ENTR|nr:DsbA family protein [Buttiauxella agrestis]KFC81211.1 ScsC family secreted protein [Buttiauxella agrestis ATCC 33320]